MHYYSERVGLTSPGAVLDLTKPVLSIRNQLKEEVDNTVHSSMVKHYQKMIRQNREFQLKKSKESTRKIHGSFKKNRRDSAVHSHKSHAISRQRLKTREEQKNKLNKLNKDIKFKLLNRNSKSKTLIKSSPESSKPFSNDRSVQLTKIDEKRPSLRIRKNKRSKHMNDQYRKTQSGEQGYSIDKSEDKNNYSHHSKTPKRHNAKRTKKEKSKSKDIKNNDSPKREFPKISERAENLNRYGETNPINNEMGGIFGMNMNEESVKDVREEGINVCTSHSNFSDPAYNNQKIEIVDWAKSTIFQQVLDGDIGINKERQNIYFQPEEVDYIIEMMKRRYRDFKTNDMLKPFFK